MFTACRNWAAPDPEPNSMRSMPAITNTNNSRSASIGANRQVPSESLGSTRLETNPTAKCPTSMFLQNRAVLALREACVECPHRSANGEAPAQNLEVAEGGRHRVAALGFVDARTHP